MSKKNDIKDIVIKNQRLMESSLIFLIFCVLPQGSNNKEIETENNGLSGQDSKSICPPEIFIEPDDEHKELMASFSRT